jgi:hypothetical protein
MMRSFDSGPMPASEPEPVGGAASQESEVQPGASGSSPDVGAGFRALALTVAAGLAAGVLAWAVGEATLIREAGLAAKGRVVRSPTVDGIRNGMVSFGAQGAALGLGLGLAAGLARRSVRSGIVAGVIGLVLGGAAGAGAARLLMPFYYANVRANSPVYSLIVHGGIWAAVGAAAGLAFGMGLGGRDRTIRALLGGVGGALVATVVYELAGILLFPLAQTDRPISLTPATRLLARLIVAVFVAWAAVAAVRAPANRRQRGAGRAR